jgi:hypothetical protein
LAQAFEIGRLRGSNKARQATSETALSMASEVPEHGNGVGMGLEKLNYELPKRPMHSDRSLRSRSVMGDVSFQGMRE